ncbi:MAG: DegV family EDD domain-containing protein [Deltaproteobacteria bacterium]|nr:DegV family EDD domain-containing protein [Deltaproteobacteria bacterium]
MRTHERLLEALALGSERVVAWADVLDRINVFPVPDGDTGRNLVISLSPFKRKIALADLARTLLMNARGNSGNIVARFMSGFLTLDDLADLAGPCRKGRDLAYRAVPDPKPGTILDFFDVLVASLEKYPQDPDGLWPDRVTADLEEAVKKTSQGLEEIKKAGVVDAGALGMFVFFDSCLKYLAGREPIPNGLGEKFKEFLKPVVSSEVRTEGFCVDAIVKRDIGNEPSAGLTELGDSIVMIEDGDYLKLHFHADNTRNAKKRLEEMGSIVAWAEDDMSEQAHRFFRTGRRQAIHIMTDAAGSMTRDDARELNVTLLDSYITIGDLCLPETYHDPLGMLAAMSRGVKVSTSRASTFEQHQHYHKVLSLYPRILYLCVGSVYTGNYEVVTDWKKGNDPENRLMIIDTGVASGKLGLAARAVAEFSLETNDPDEVIRYAKEAVRQCEEYIFLDRLQYLAAGGRMSKTGAFFGDMLHVKPIVSPMPDGAARAGIARSEKDQMAFAFKQLDSFMADHGNALIMLEYTDNIHWVRDRVEAPIRTHYPQARIILQQFSLTSSVHMGPGTWGIAFLPKRT